MGSDSELTHDEKIGKLGAEVHSLSASVNKLFDKFDDFLEKNQPVPMSVGSYIGIAVTILTGFAILFGSVIYITNSSNAPLITQLSQTTALLQSMQNNIQRNTSFIQLTNKEVSGIKSMASGNEDTLRWMIFEENIPKQITILQERVDHITEKLHK